MGLVVNMMGEFGKAERVYEVLLGTGTEESVKGVIYGQLGLMKDEQGEYVEANGYYGKSIEIKEKQIPCNEPSLATSYSNISGLYRNTGDN